MPLQLIVTVSGGPLVSNNLLFAAAATAKRSRLSATSCSRISSSASLRYRSLNSSNVISERADFFEAADRPERSPLMIPLLPEFPELAATGMSSSCDLEVPIGVSNDISPAVVSLEEGSR